MRPIVLALIPTATIHHAGSLSAPALQTELTAIAQQFDGRLGVCVLSPDGGKACVRGTERFSLQSVVKLVAGVAAVEQGLSLDEPITVHRKDLSVYVQPIAEKVTEQGFRTTIGDLVRRSIIDSDSAAVDVLIARMGGPKAVQASLDRLKIRGMRVDRDEKTLQCDILGIPWKPEFADPQRFEEAIAQITAAARTKAYAKYQADPRDTSTPEAMADMLARLQSGKLLPPAGTAFLMEAMKDCATGMARLKAGTAPGWTLAHKTGTAGSWNGVSAATNDVGVLTAPDGGWIAVAVFVGDSKADPAEREAVIARVAAAVIRNYQVRE
jgi:beta-lactamase class A